MLSNLEFAQARRKMNSRVFSQRLGNVLIEVFNRTNADRLEHPLLVGGSMGSIAHAGLLLLLVVLIFFLFVLVLVLFVVLFFLLRYVFGVFFRGHQILEIILVGHLHANHPAIAVGMTDEDDLKDLMT